MANTIYLRAKSRFMGDNDASAPTTIDLDTDTINVILAGQSGAYTPDAAAHEFFTDIVGPRGESGSDTYVDGAALGTKTVSLGAVFDALDTTMLAVASGAQCEQLVIYKEGAAAASSPLICWIDTATSGLPVTPNGGDILITWNAAGIFTL